MTTCKDFVALGAAEQVAIERQPVGDRPARRRRGALLSTSGVCDSAVWVRTEVHQDHRRFGDEAKLLPPLRRGLRRRVGPAWNAQELSLLPHPLGRSSSRDTTRAPIGAQGVLTARRLALRQAECAMQKGCAPATLDSDPDTSLDADDDILRRRCSLAGGAEEDHAVLDAALNTAPRFIPGAVPRLNRDSAAVDGCTDAPQKRRRVGHPVPNFDARVHRRPPGDSIH